ncbi:hypothetical protein COY05_03355 [Candidatus Peregrinibacteria bacterium CG_4_10_14_0_2_um_filter_38_24]|nr:MAG: hypothetical protein COY05_03355 [Candidatus Peregrinibacteria bacterium CG_4_10_14_0_2_um_filter_38_24]
MYNPTELKQIYMDPKNDQGQGAQPAGQNPQGQGQTQPQPPQPPQGAGQGGAGQAQPQGIVPPAMYPPQGYPQGGMPGAYPQMPPQGYPQGGMQPGMYPPPGYPQPGMYSDMGMGGQQGLGGGMPTQEPEDTTPANFPLGTKFVQPIKITLPKNELSFDEKYFVTLLAGSISLSKEEKKRIIDSVPKLKQSQIDELINIFEEEKEKFAALSKKHVPKLEELAQQHYNEWMDLETESEQVQKKSEDQDKAEAIRKQLGL